MEVYEILNINDLPKLDTSSLTIGNFDGVHIGHRNLIEATKIDGYKTMVISFENINKGNYNLTNKEQKIEYLRQLDVDYLLIFPFEVVKNVFYNEFMKVLKKLNVKYITCGTNFRFGYKREGDIIDLKKKFKVTIFDDYFVEEEKVSTSLIKEYLMKGDIDKVNILLEKPYKIVGEVISGSKIGRKLGFPTANIDYKEYLLPKNGVYFTIAKYQDKNYLSMTNVGFNPTLNEQSKKRLEVHILDFDQEIYGETLELSFIKYLRDEKKYDSKEELINSLNETISICREYQDMIK